MEKLEKYYAIFRHKWETFKISEYKNYFVKLIFAVIAGFVAAFVLFLLMRPSSVFTAFLNFIKGSFGAGRSGIAKALNYSAPVMLAADSVSFSKKAGQFNVGMCGQFVIGAVASVFVFDQCSMLAPVLRSLAAIISAVVLTALWAFIPAFLKIFRNVDVFLSGMLLNFTAVFAADWVIASAGFSSKVKISGISTLAAVVAAVFVAFAAYIVVSKTVFGFEMKAVGSNPAAALNAGINDRKVLFVTLPVSGAVAGLGGAVMYLSASNMNPFAGFDMVMFALCAIAVSCISNFNPAGTIFISLLFGHYAQGASYTADISISKYILGVVFAVMMYIVSYAPLKTDKSALQEKSRRVRK